MTRKKRMIIVVASLLGLLLVTYGTMIYNDYNLVLNLYKKPAFAINHDAAYQAYYDCVKAGEDPIAAGYDIFVINSGTFQGLGYTIELSGSFRPYSEIYYETTDTLGRQVVRGENEIVYNLDTKEVLNPVPGVLQARFVLFGREVGRLSRPYPAGFFTPRGFELQDIF